MDTSGLSSDSPPNTAQRAVLDKHGISGAHSGPLKDTGIMHQGQDGGGYGRAQHLATYAHGIVGLEVRV